MFLFTLCILTHYFLTLSLGELLFCTNFSTWIHLRCSGAMGGLKKTQEETI